MTTANYELRTLARRLEASLEQGRVAGALICLEQWLNPRRERENPYGYLVAEDWKERLEAFLAGDYEPLWIARRAISEAAK